MTERDDFKEPIHTPDRRMRPLRLGLAAIIALAGLALSRVGLGEFALVEGAAIALAWTSV